MRVLISLLVAALLSPAGDLTLDAQRLRLIPARMQEHIDRGEIAGIVTLVGRGDAIAEMDLLVSLSAEILPRREGSGERNGDVCETKSNAR